MTLQAAAASGAAASTSGMIVARLLAGRSVKRMVRAVLELHRIASMLDTTTPGGLRDVEDAIRRHSGEPQ